MKQYREFITEVFERVDAAGDYSSREKEHVTGGYTAESMTECIRSGSEQDRNFRRAAKWCLQVKDLPDSGNVLARIDEIDGSVMHTPMPHDLALVLRRWLAMMQLCTDRRKSVEYAAANYCAGIPGRYRAVALKLLGLNPGLEWDGGLLVAPIVTALLDKTQNFAGMPADDLYHVLHSHMSESQRQKLDCAGSRCFGKEGVSEMIVKLAGLKGDCLVSGVMMSEFTALFSAVAVYDYQRNSRSGRN